jgi:hypothetical protein
MLDAADKVDSDTEEGGDGGGGIVETTDLSIENESRYRLDTPVRR